MASRFDLLLWVALGLHLVGMAILATESLPPAVARAMDVAPLAEGWTFPAGCLSW